MNGAINVNSGSATIRDSYIDASPNGTEQTTGIEGSHFTAVRVEVVGGFRGVYCGHGCTVRDSWIHGRTSVTTGTWAESA